MTSCFRELYVFRNNKNLKFENSKYGIEYCPILNTFLFPYRLLVIESMDKDTEVRRLSPVAVLSENGYIDLVNGPQDHGWCFGYTCQERLSTFHVMIALGQTFEIAMTSTPAQHLRYHLLNSGADDYVVVKFWYPKQQRYIYSLSGIFDFL